MENVYAVCMDRTPDEEGFNYWTTILDSGKDSRTNALNNFLRSDEFKEICETYGMTAGSWVTGIGEGTSITPGVCGRCGGDGPCLGLRQGNQSSRLYHCGH